MNLCARWWEKHGKTEDQATFKVAKCKADLGFWMRDMNVSDLTASNPSALNSVQSHRF